MRNKRTAQISRRYEARTIETRRGSRRSNRTRMDTTRRKLFELGKRIGSGVTRADVKSDKRPYEPGRLTPNEGHYERKQNAKRKQRRIRTARCTTGSPTECGIKRELGTPY